MSKPSKYDPLTTFLSAQQEDVIEVTFSEMEAVLGFKLPKYSKSFEFWANEDDFEKPGRHTQSRAWQRAGFKVKHQIEKATVQFIRKSSER
jgi:hypothetical protein